MVVHRDYPASGSQLQTACAAHFARRADVTLANWGLMIVNLPTFRAVPDLPLPRLLGEMPDLHAALVAVLAVSPSDPSVSGAEQMLVDAATRHASCRYQDRFPISSLLDDLAVLRDTLLATAGDWAIDNGLPSLPESLTQRLLATLDTALTLLCETWVSQATADLTSEPIATAS